MFNLAGCTLGKYRLIDIPISNCINSGINRIEVLTMYNSVSLNRHIARAYVFDAFHRGWVEVLAAEQTIKSESWYQGTADAVRKQMDEIQSTGADYTLILAGDHLYRMDYRPMTDFHWEMNDIGFCFLFSHIQNDGKIVVAGCASH
jgi:glucose-1-phosphate adenylyltransferase